MLNVLVQLRPRKDSEEEEDADDGGSVVVDNYHHWHGRVFVPLVRASRSLLFAIASPSADLIASDMSALSLHCGLSFSHIISGWSWTKAQSKGAGLVLGFALGHFGGTLQSTIPHRMFPSICALRTWPHRFTWRVQVFEGNRYRPSRILITPLNRYPSPSDMRPSSRPAVCLWLSPSR